jgi:hypothetical protein
MATDETAARLGELLAKATPGLWAWTTCEFAPEGWRLTGRRQPGHRLPDRVTIFYNSADGKLIPAMERERCAGVAERMMYGDIAHDAETECHDDACHKIAAAIRNGQ